MPTPRVLLACLFLCGQCLLAHGFPLRLLSVRHGSQHGEHRGAKHTAAQMLSEAPSTVPSLMHGAHADAVTDTGAEAFLASCGFSTADLPGPPVKWYTAASACRVLDKLDRLVFAGDSLTRQVHFACSKRLLPHGLLPQAIGAEWPFTAWNNGRA